MKYTTHLSPSECRKRLANPTGNPTPEIKEIVNNKYLSYFDESEKWVRLGTRINGYDFELFCTYRNRHGLPNKPQACLSGKISESETGGSIIGCHFRPNAETVCASIIVPIFFMFSLFLVISADDNLMKKLLMFVVMSGMIGLYIATLGNWKILLDLLKDLLEIRQSSVTEKTLQP